MSNKTISNQLKTKFIKIPICSLNIFLKQISYCRIFLFIHSLLKSVPIMRFIEVGIWSLRNNPIWVYHFMTAIIMGFYMIVFQIKVINLVMIVKCYYLVIIFLLRKTFYLINTSLIVPHSDINAHFNTNVVSDKFVFFNMLSNKSTTFISSRLYEADF